MPPATTASAQGAEGVSAQASAQGAEGVSAQASAQGAEGVSAQASTEGGELVIGIDLGGTKCHGTLAQVDGTIIAHEIRATALEDAYGTVIGCVGALQAAAAAYGRQVAGIGVGVPAVVDPDSGRAFDGPNVGWHGFDLGERLLSDLDVPLAIENDADLAAVGEARRGAATGIRDFVVVSIGTGIGGAVVVDGRLVKGRHNAAGEIGAMVFDRAYLSQPTRGGLGAFESVAAGPGVASRAASLLAAPHPTVLESALKPGGITAESVFAAASAGDAVARATIDAVLDDLAMALIALISMLDPAAIILDGSVGRALHAHLDELVRRVVRHAPSTPTVTISALEPTATLVGALVTAGEVVLAPAGSPYFGTLVRSLTLVPHPLREQPA